MTCIFPFSFFICIVNIHVYPNLSMHIYITTPRISVSILTSTERWHCKPHTRLHFSFQRLSLFFFAIPVCLLHMWNEIYQVYFFACPPFSISISPLSISFNIFTPPHDLISFLVFLENLSVFFDDLMRSKAWGHVIV